MWSFTGFPGDEQTGWHAFYQTTVAMTTESDFRNDNVMRLIAARYPARKLDNATNVAIEIYYNAEI
jgi:hypothetical protein